MVSEARREGKEAAAASADIFDGGGAAASAARGGAPRKQCDVPLQVVTISGHKVTCVNLETQIALKVNDHSLAFVAEYVVALMRTVIHALAKNSDHKKAFVPEVPRAPFSFVRNPTPIIKDKVTWEPTTYSWAVHTKDKSGTTKTHRVTVDGKLASEAFAEMKLTKYTEALRLWNSTDGSKRLRIPDLPLVADPLHTPGCK